jgi:hypothetical protein
MQLRTQSEGELSVKPDDTRFLTAQITDAYLEMTLGIMVLRIPQIQDLLIPNIPEAVVTTSYFDNHENLVINAKRILEELKAEGLTNVRSLQNSFRQVNRIFILSMWDILTEHRRFDAISTEPEIQFFRHVRNACAHDGTLNFEELKHPARWRDKQITETMRGINLFPDIMKDGDPFLLVLDVNNKFFSYIEPR